MNKFASFLGGGLGFIAYAALFFLPKLPTFKLFGVFNVELLALFFTGGWLIFTAKSPGARPRWIFFSLVLITFTLPLIRVWQNAVSNYYLVLELLPWSDANGYFTDAHQLLNG